MHMQRYFPLLRFFFFCSAKSKYINMLNTNENKHFGVFFVVLTSLWIIIKQGLKKKNLPKKA